MGSYNCIGFHSRLPIGSGDEAALFIGLHASPQLEGRYGFDPVEFAPGLRFTPIALPIMCRYYDGRMVRDVVRDGNVEALELFFGRRIDEILLYCDYDRQNEVSLELERVVNEKLGLSEGDFKLTYTFDHRFVYDEIAKMPVWWDYERSYELTLELSDISAGTEIRKIPESSRMLLEVLAVLEDGNDKEEALKLVEEGRKYYSMSLDLEFQKRNVGTFTNITNLNPKYTGSSIFSDCESYRGSLLLAVYRYHADILFSPQLKELFLGFLQFYQVLRYYGWMLTLPIYGGQDDRSHAMAPLYRRMVEWVDERTK